MPKHIAILGSTGSIGTQTLEVINSHADKLVVEVLTANKNSDLLIKQAKEFKPNAVVIADKTQYTKVKDALPLPPVYYLCIEDFCILCLLTTIYTF